MLLLITTIFNDHEQKIHVVFIFSFYVPFGKNLLIITADGVCFWYPEVDVFCLTLKRRQPFWLEDHSFRCLRTSFEISSLNVLEVSLTDGDRIVLKKVTFGK